MGQNFLEPFQNLVELGCQANTFLVTVSSEQIKNSIDEYPGGVNTFVYVYQLPHKGLETFLGKEFLVLT